MGGRVRLAMTGRQVDGGQTATEVSDCIGVVVRAGVDAGSSAQNETRSASTKRAGTVVLERT